ncbi:MAG TPA: hypothetical protein VF079_07830 [Sphingomicrobium sp.]
MPTTARRGEPAPVADGGAQGATSDAGGGDPNYYNKLITLFPAEALTLYGTGVAIFGAAPGSHTRSPFYMIAICLVVLVFLRMVANQPKDPTQRPPVWRVWSNTDLPAVIVAVISFLLWATATDPNWLDGAPKGLQLFGKFDGTFIRQWAAFLGAAFVLVAPNFVEPPPTP